MKLAFYVLRGHYNDVVQGIMTSHMENGEKMCDKEDKRVRTIFKNCD